MGGLDFLMTNSKGDAGLGYKMKSFQEFGKKIRRIRRNSAAQREFQKNFWSPRKILSPKF